MKSDGNIKALKPSDTQKSSVFPQTKENVFEHLDILFVRFGRLFYWYHFVFSHICRASSVSCVCLFAFCIAYYFCWRFVWNVNYICIRCVGLLLNIVRVCMSSWVFGRNLYFAANLRFKWIFEFILCFLSALFIVIVRQACVYFVHSLRRMHKANGAGFVCLLNGNHVHLNLSLIHKFWTIVCSTFSTYPLLPRSGFCYIHTLKRARVLAKIKVKRDAYQWFFFTCF